MLHFRSIPSIIACGPLVHQALVAAQELKKMKIEAMVINMHTIKPLDAQAVVAAAQKCKAVVTVEEHQVAGGLGGAVAEVLAKKAPTPIEFIGMQDTFGQSGKPSELLHEYGMDAPAILAAAKRVIARK